MVQNDGSFLNVERKIIEWITRLVRSDFKWLGRILIKGLRFAWRNKPGPTERSPKEAIANPTGPYATKRTQQVGDLLLWVPRHFVACVKSRLGQPYDDLEALTTGVILFVIKCNRLNIRKAKNGHIFAVPTA